MSCVFCAIVAGESPSFRVYEDETTLAFLDIRPITRGHTLVIPKAHAQDLTDLKPDDAAAIMTVGQRIANAMRGSELQSDGTNLALNDGRVAFQTVMHAHLHVVPAAVVTSWPSQRDSWFGAIPIWRRPPRSSVQRCKPTSQENRSTSPATRC